MNQTYKAGYTDALDQISEEIRRLSWAHKNTIDIVNGIIMYIHYLRDMSSHGEDVQVFKIELH